MSNTNEKAAAWSVNAGLWFYATSGLSPLGAEAWSASAFLCKKDLALDFWRKFGDPGLFFEPSPRSAGCVCHGQLRPAGWGWENARELQEVVAFSAGGEELSPKGLVDFGAQLAAASGEAGAWEWRARGWRFRFDDWNGFGPVPGTGKRGRYRRFRNSRLGAGARKGWMGEIFAAAQDLVELDGLLWSHGSQAAAISQLENGARAIGDDLLGWFDEPRRARQGHSWKNAKRKRLKAWDWG